MRVFMTGGTGFVGSCLAERFAQAGHEVIVLTRSAARSNMPGVTGFVEGDPKKPGPWQEIVRESDVVINLAGVSIFTLWTDKARREIMDSRLLATRNVAEAMRAAKRPMVLLSASAVGYYGGRLDDATLGEDSPAGDDFLAKVARSWEAEARRAESADVRVVLCRFGIVLGRNGGALSKMLPAFKKFMGSPLGTGKQWFPWIHEEDLFRIMLFLGEKSTISGPVNCVAPHPIRNEEMTRVVAKTLRRPIVMPAVPSFVLKKTLGEFGDVLLKGQRAAPAKFLEAGFQFRFPTFQEALRELLD